MSQSKGAGLVEGVLTTVGVVPVVIALCVVEVEELVVDFIVVFVDEEVDIAPAVEVVAVGEAIVVCVPVDVVVAV